MWAGKAGGGEYGGQTWQAWECSSEPLARGPSSSKQLFVLLHKYKSDVQQIGGGDEQGNNLPMEVALGEGDGAVPEVIQTLSDQLLILLYLYLYLLYLHLFLYQWYRYWLINYQFSWLCVQVCVCSDKS